ncbi:UNVERIFIED_CONTAM: LytR family transcriptional attenuator [Williamsia faeni]
MSDDELRARTSEERRDEIRRRLGAPSDEVLREPTSRELTEGDRNRVTVRELLNRMNAAAGSDDTPDAGEATTSNTPPPSPRAQHAAPPNIPPQSPPTQSPTSPPAPTPPPPAPTPALTFRRPRRVGPAEAPTEQIIGAGEPPVTADDAKTEVIPATPAVTEYIPAVKAPAPIPDLSDNGDATRSPRSVTPGSDTGSRRKHAAPAKERDHKQMLHRATIGGRILIALACVLALLGTGAVWGYQKVKDSNWNTVEAVNPDNEEIRDKQLQTGDETYLIVGTDTRSGQNGTVGAGDATEFEGSARSDTVLLVNIPADRSRVVAVSFPRDLQVDRPECAGWNNDDGQYTTDVVPSETQVKLNSVYGVGGPKCLVETLTTMSGLNINHFIAMDFYGFEQVVNKIGGVEVCSTTPLEDYELGTILAKPGKKTLKGSKALDYVRARNIETEGNGDYGRIKRQQLFMSSLLRGALSSQVLTNPATLNGIIDTFIKYSYVDQVNTDDLLQLGQSMQGLDAGRVTFLTVPTSGTAEDGSGNEIPRLDDINAIFDAIINDMPLPGEKTEAPKPGTTTPSTTATTAPKPEQVTVAALSPYSISLRVLNGTGVGGVAADAANELAGHGFEINGVADASENRTDTVVRYGPGQQEAAATVAHMFPGATIQADSTVSSGVEVIVGSDFSGTLGEVPPEGSQVSVRELPRDSNPDELPNDLTVTNAGDTTCA